MKACDAHCQLIELEAEKESEKERWRENINYD